ncbi:nudC domain-containing protein 3-like [Branchiostoma floridae]|uniref:NudC domain-containing protein 3 n=1 Tax=Branchiostoma floridae TaxID=7739 RepID=A0A9J7KR21_BRAFL|nr:nudC domain-containing protein 3-like [Branchiostoma floridae]
MASPEMYDTALLGILQHQGKIENFLDVMFGFLYRRTDFFRTMRSKEDRMGFPPGVQEKMLYSIFKKWQHYATQDEERMMKKLQEKAEKERQAAAAASAVVEEVEVETTQTPENMEKETDKPSSPEKTQTVATSKVDTAPASEAKSDGQKDEERKERTDGETVDTKEALKDASKTDAKTVEGTEANEGASAKPTSQEEFQQDAESWNGAVRENYKWAQHIHEVEIRVHVPQNIKKAKDCVVDIKNNFVKVAIKDGGQVKVLMEGKLTNKIICEESMWSLEPGKCVQVNLEKEKEYWWKAVLVGEPEIDIQKIEPIKHMHDMDDEEQSGVQRMMFDQHQKMMGKPQSHEMKVHDMLKKGWDAPGSPFAGQEFDPTKFNISPGAVQM